MNIVTPSPRPNSTARVALMARAAAQWQSLSPLLLAALGGSLVFALGVAIVASMSVTPLPPTPPTNIPIRATPTGALYLDGSSAVRVPLLLDDVNDVTIECWARGVDREGQQALLSNKHYAGLALFFTHTRLGMPHVSGWAGVTHVTGMNARGYSIVEALDPKWSETEHGDRWHHYALVVEGVRVRLFVDGHCVSTRSFLGRRRASPYEFLIGASPDGRHEQRNYFTGEIDEVRVSRGARYRDTFRPALRHESDDDTLLLLSFDDAGPELLIDRSWDRPDGNAIGRVAWTDGEGAIGNED